MLISNHRERQPEENFLKLCHRFTSVKVVTGNERYLVVAVKDSTPKTAGEFVLSKRSCE